MYETTDDTGDAFIAAVLARGLTPPDTSEVLRWGFAVIGEVDGAEWLVWDAEAVTYPDDTAPLSGP